jgi:hypothetical protein
MGSTWRAPANVFERDPFAAAHDLEPDPRHRHERRLDELARHEDRAREALYPPPRRIEARATPIRPPVKPAA